MSIDSQALELHRRLKGKIALHVKMPITSREDLSLAYTPGVAAPCREIAAHPETVWDYTSRGNWVAVVTDGSAVLGLGNIGPRAGLPVMEGKCVLFKEFAGLDAFPICLDTQDPDAIVAAVKAIAPSFAAVNLEDISAPRCFEIEERLKAELEIPVMHDDQHGTAIVVSAGLINACRVTGRELTQLKVVILGAGAAGVAIAKMLTSLGITDIIAVDRGGIISSARQDLNEAKHRLLEITNRGGLLGSLDDAMKGRDVFIGVSVPGLVTAEHIKVMAPEPFVFALSNPTPEIMPDLAKAAGAVIVATGRSDFPNQINNVLAYPGVFRGAIDTKAPQITEAMKRAAAQALADHVAQPTAEMILPSALDKSVASTIATAVQSAV